VVVVRQERAAGDLVEGEANRDVVVCVVVAAAAAAVVMTAAAARTAQWSGRMLTDVTASEAAAAVAQTARALEAADKIDYD
jgi:hypothetical protein